jgi:CPA2 family monovalent cation:H+ antiporter-2
MHEISYLLEFAFFIVFALLGTVISLKLRQPYVVGLLVFGMLAGPHLLGLVQNDGLIMTFSELGAILLLFTVGIEFSVSRMLKSGLRAMIITVIKMSLLFFFGYETALYFGLDLVSASFVGMMIAITSTALLFKIVTQKGMKGNPILPLLFSMLIVEDMIAVGALTFFSSVVDGAPTQEDKAVSVLLSIGFLGLFYAVIRRPASDAVYRLTSTLNEDVMILVSFSLCLVMSMVASALDLSPVIGAFLAGSIIASLPNSKKMERTLRPLLLLFAALFFLSLGMRIDPASVIDHFWLAAALVAVFVVVCFSSVYVLLYTTGASSKNALFGASAMVVLGEFSLIIASLASGETGNLLVAVGSMGVLATAIASSFLLDRQEAIWGFGKQRLPEGAKMAGKRLSFYFSGILRDFSPRGNFWGMSNVCWPCVRSKIGMIAVIAVLIVALRIAVAFSGMPREEAVPMRLAILAAGMLPMLYYLAGILQDIAPILDALSGTIARHRKSARAEQVILKDAAIALALIIFAAVLPDLEIHFQLPEIFWLADEIALLVAFAFVWDIAKNAGRLGGTGRRRLEKAGKGGRTI